MPYEGQRVKVKAIFQADGSVLAREIENKRGAVGTHDDSGVVKLEGDFQGVDDDGNWIVDGATVSVDPKTLLKGTPTVGEQVEVKGFIQEDGSLLAKKIDGEQGGPSKPKSEAKIEGTPEDILDDGTLIIDGIAVTLSVLTEFDGDPQVGDSVAVEALLQADGSLLAREVDSTGTAGDEDAPPDTVEIEGEIELVNDDGTLVVNGITVAASVLSEIKGDLTEGSSVKIEGVLLANGSILAGELKGEGRRATASGSDVKIDGLVESVERDENGNVLSVTVDGLTIGVEALTDLDVVLEEGAEVEIKGIISGGTFLASRVKSDKAKTPALNIQGTIEALNYDESGQLVSVTINGVEVSVEAFADLEGALEVGGVAKLRGAIGKGQLKADKVEGKGKDEDKGGPPEGKGKSGGNGNGRGKQ